jgi:hypothetical protein
MNVQLTEDKENVMQRAKIITVIGFFGMLTACGGAPMGPGNMTSSTDAALFAGRWSYRSGLSRLTCGTQTRDVALTGSETLERGANGALEWVSQSFGCRFRMTIDDDTATVVSGQSCHVAAGANSGTVQPDGTSFTLSGDGRSLVESGAAMLRYDDGRVCTASFSGTLALP